MKLVRNNTVELIDTFTKKTFYNISIVTNDECDIFPAATPIEKELKLTNGYYFSFDDANSTVNVFLNYNQISAGKCALIAHLLTKTEIEQLTDILWKEYHEALDEDLLSNMNMSERFFKSLTRKDENKHN